MTVLIFHPTEELKLIQFQKELIEELNTTENIFYCHTPLWLQLEQLNSLKTASDLKNFSKTIRKITAGKVYFDKNNNVAVDFEIETEDKKIKTALTLLCPYKLSDDKKSTLKKECPVKNIKIFRLGISVEPAQNSKAISDSVWVKIKS